MVGGKKMGREEMEELKVGDVIEVVECDGHCENCYSHTELCGKGIKLKLRTGPKQGDTVWVQYAPGSKYEPCTFVCDYKDRFVISRGSNLHLFEVIHTEDPYAIKYTLTPQEALIAIGQGKKVAGNRYSEGVHAMWTEEDGLCSKSPKTGICSHNPIHLDQMYAIIEE